MTDPRFTQTHTTISMVDNSVFSEQFDENRPLSAGACLLQADFSYQAMSEEAGHNAVKNGWTEETLNALNIGDKAILYTEFSNNHLFVWLIERVS